MKQNLTTLTAQAGQWLLYSALGVLFATGSARAQAGNALNFDGTNDYVSLPASLTTGVTNFTFEGWLNYQPNGNWTRMMDFGTGTNTNMFLTPRNGENATPRFAITTGGAGGEQRITSTTVLTAGQHHLAVTLSQAGTVVTGTLYVDGAVAASNTNMTLTPNSLGTLTQLYLGRSQYAADPYLKGDLDEVRIYGAALTQAQVQADMKNSTGSTSALPASLRAYYNFNQGIANGNNPNETSLLDRSGNARSGTLTNFALTAGTTSNWIGSTAPLPVTLVRFAAERQRADGLLTWATASEVRNAYFEVESSLDGIAFRALGRVAGHGTTNEAQAYQFVDARLARYASAAVYYRLRQVDTDGTGTYSPVRALQVPGGALALAVAAFPTRLPAGQALRVQVSAPLTGAASLSVTDELGRAVLQQPLDLPAGTTTLALPQAVQWPRGLYLVRVQQGSWHQVAKVVCE